MSAEANNGNGKQPWLADVGVIALVPDEWNGFWQTRHHVVSRLSKYFQVVWVDPTADAHKHTGADSAAEPKASTNGDSAHPTQHTGFVNYRAERWIAGLQRIHRLNQLRMQQILRKARRLLIRRGCRRIILYIWRPAFASALDNVPHDLSCYHIDDEYSFSPIELPLSETERRLITEVDLVFLHSMGLLEKKGNINPHTIFIPNGVDFQAYSHTQPEPPDLAAIPHPRIGYTGFIKRQLDWQLVLTLSHAHPEWHFVFVGPQSPHEDIVAIIQQLTALPNVHFLGAKPTESLPAYPQHFDVCIMPYQDNYYTKYIYPLKLHEYLASGRPVVGTRILTLSEFADVVALAHSPEEWAAAIAQSLAPAANTPERRQRRQEIARRFDWESLVFEIATKMAEGLGESYAARLNDFFTHNGKRKIDLSAYRASPREQKRVENILAVIPKNYSTVLDVGARDGYISDLLANNFEAVTALDLEKPQVSNRKTVAVQGDVTQLTYPDNYFDVVTCTEVLEHIPPQLLARACQEMTRVAKHAVVVGVPFKQDRRFGRTTCVYCGQHNPCWGHVNDFDEQSLARLFPGMIPAQTTFVGQTSERTNAISAFLMDQAGNPWGTYEQDEACIHCGNQLIQPAGRTILEKVSARVASVLNQAQSLFVSPRPIWMHMVFKKPDTTQSAPSPRSKVAPASLPASGDQRSQSKPKSSAEL